MLKHKNNGLLPHFFHGAIVVPHAISMLVKYNFNLKLRFVHYLSHILIYSQIVTILYERGFPLDLFDINVRN